MVRATRSSASHHDKPTDDVDKAPSSSPPHVLKAKIALNKKRKRISGQLDLEDVPSTKQLRSDDGDDVIMMDDDGHDTDGPSLVAELPLKDDDAQKILDILEMYVSFCPMHTQTPHHSSSPFLYRMDTQGLLDRVFPLDDAVLIKGSSSPSGSNAPSDSFSLRTLLKESGDHPLRVYRVRLSILSFIYIYTHIGSVLY